MQNKIHITVDTQRVLCEQIYIKKSLGEAKQFIVDLAKSEKFPILADYELPQQILELKRRTL